MNTILDFVQSLQEMKKTQLKWTATELPERAAALQKFAQTIFQNSQSYAEKISAAENLPVTFVLENAIQPAIASLESLATASVPTGNLPKATGLISVIPPRFFAFRSLAERVGAALMAGNGVFILTQNENETAGLLWREILGADLPVRVFHGQEDLLEILCTHPALQAVSFYGYPEAADKVLKSVSGSWKKWQISSGFHNSALILNDVSLPEVAQKLVESCFQGMGQLHWNISNIFVTEAHLEEFKKEFLGAMEAHKFGPMKEADLQRTQSVWNQMRGEKNGNVLFGGDVLGDQVRPLVVQDLTHCSTLQQDCLLAPMVLISPVKYVHEMVKWTNTAYYGMHAQIFGPEEKIEKFASQLEVSQVSANSWIESMSTLPLGLKQSFSGIPDLGPFGGFFSDLRKIDRSQSRK